MPEFNDIKNLWNSANSQILVNETLDSETVKQAISKQSIGITSKLLKSLRVFGLHLSSLANPLIVCVCVSVNNVKTYYTHSSNYFV